MALRYEMINVRLSPLDKLRLVKELGWAGVVPALPGACAAPLLRLAAERAKIQIPALIAAEAWRHDLAAQPQAFAEAQKMLLEAAGQARLLGAPCLILPGAPPADAVRQALWHANLSQMAQRILQDGPLVLALSKMPDESALPAGWQRAPLVETGGAGSTPRPWHGGAPGLGFKPAGWIYLEALGGGPATLLQAARSAAALLASPHGI